VQRRGFFLRVGTKLIGKGANALLILTECGAVLPGPGVQPHERALRRFVQRVERHPAPGMRDGVGYRAGSQVGLHKLFEHLAVELVQAFALEELPLVELPAVRQREASQEFVAVEFGSGGKLLGALLAGGMRGGCGETAGGQCAEREHVDPNGSVRVQAHLCPVGEQQVAERRFEQRKFAAQVVARAVGVELRPQQRQQCVAVARLRLGGQIRQESERLGAAQRHVAPVVLDARRAEEVHAQHAVLL
jgi:hypothetical protein